MQGVGASSAQLVLALLVLTDEEQSMPGSVLLVSVATQRAGLTGVVRIHFDGN
jgi:hypothetical protein